MDTTPNTTWPELYKAVATNAWVSKLIVAGSLAHFAGGWLIYTNTIETATTTALHIGFGLIGCVVAAFHNRYIVED